MAVSKSRVGASMVVSSEWLERQIASNGCLSEVIWGR
jgi:hypothetical protein